MLGSTKLNTHIHIAIATTLVSSTKEKEKIQIETVLFSTTSNKDSMGIAEAIRYMENTLVMALI